MEIIDYLLPIDLKIRIRGNENDKEMIFLKNDLENKIDKLYAGKDIEKWKEFFKIKEEFEEKVNCYEGEFSEYFYKALGSINNQEKFALGYHLK
jgi:hypothetical protein